PYPCGRAALRISHPAGMRAWDVASSYLASVARAGSGMAVSGAGARPAQPLELYEFEGCPYCRKVREALSILDLDAMIWPCPQNVPGFRPRPMARGGKSQFPYLVDPNTDTEMYESDDIIRYLWSSYGSGAPPAALTLPVVTDLTSMLASAARVSGGRNYRRA